ncbi:MAG: YfhO family protein, partial [Candidatus Promineifilaceae bacterium]
VLSYEPERIELSVNTSDSGLLVLTEANYPGWKAKINGQEVTIQQTDGLFRGVVVPPGQHQVIFTFRSLSYQIGLILTLITLTLFLITVAFVKRNP